MSARVGAISLQLITHIKRYSEDVDPMVLYNILKNEGEAITLDVDFLYNLSQLRIQLGDDDDILEDALLDAVTVGD